MTKKRAKKESKKASPSNPVMRSHPVMLGVKIREHGGGGSDSGHYVDQVVRLQVEGSNFEVAQRLRELADTIVHTSPWYSSKTRWVVLVGHSDPATEGF